VTAYSDAFFGPIEHFRQLEQWHRECDADYARDTLNELVAAARQLANAVIVEKLLIASRSCRLNASNTA
jgi:hypothetical protein